jgi:acyl-coenzyme A thioesterase PaaI-like protein
MMEARWVPQPGWEGFPGIIHGGIVCTVLDEAMSKAVAAAVGDALTAEIKVRLRRPVRPGQELTIRGWIVERHRRRTRTEAVVAGIDGEEFAHAWATFLAPPAGPRKTEIEGDAR